MDLIPKVGELLRKLSAGAFLNPRLPCGIGTAHGEEML